MSCGYLFKYVKCINSLAPLLPPTDDELYQYSCLIEDIDTLAKILNIPHDQFEEIKKKFYKNKQFQAFQLLKKWCECTRRSRQDLSQLLKNVCTKQNRFLHYIISLHYTYLLALMKGTLAVAYSEESNSLLKQLLLLILCLKIIIAARLLHA